MPQPDPNVEPLKDTDAAKIREAVAALSRADKKKARRKPETPQDVADAGSDNETHLKPQLTEAPAISDALRRAEAMLFASAQPISAEELASSLPQGADVAQILMELKALYTGRGVELVEVAGKWRFQTASDLSFLFEETREEQRKLSRAALETLASHRLSPTRYAGRDRRCPRRGRLTWDTGRPDGDELGEGEGTSTLAWPSHGLWRDRCVSGTFRSGKPRHAAGTGRNAPGWSAVRRRAG